MRDPRPYITVHDGFDEHSKVEALSDGAFRLLVSLWCYCHRSNNDGMVPAAAWRKRGTPKARRELLAAPFVVEQPNGDVLMRDYEEHQQTAAERAALREKRVAAGAAGGRAKAANRPSKPLASARAPARASAMAGALAEPKPTPSKNVAAVAVDVLPSEERPPSPGGVRSDGPVVSALTGPRPPLRLDVEQVCSAVVAAEVHKGSKKPTVTDTWRREARLMLDNDGRQLADVLAIIEWTKDHRFWRANIRSVPKLREQYDTLRLQKADEKPAVNVDAAGRRCPPGQEHLEPFERYTQVTT